MQPRLQKAIAEIANHQSLRHLLRQIPLEQRHRILVAQAEAMAQHYQENTDWQELDAGDFLKTPFNQSDH